MNAIVIEGLCLLYGMTSKKSENEGDYNNLKKKAILLTPFEFNNNYIEIDIDAIYTSLACEFEL
jgi:hypothetical protein